MSANFHLRVILPLLVVGLVGMYAESLMGR